MKRRFYILSLLWITALCLSACSPAISTDPPIDTELTAPAHSEPTFPATSEPPAPEISESQSPDPDVVPEYIIVEPRFTLDTVPEYGNTKNYMTFLYEPKNAVFRGLGLEVPDIVRRYDLPDTETLWERDFAVMFFFSHTTTRLEGVMYSLTVPAESAEEETARLRDLLIELYGEPDLRNLHMAYSELETRWTLDKHHAVASDMEDLSKSPIYKEAEGIGVTLVFSCKGGLPVNREEDDPDDKSVKYISLIYELTPYFPQVLLPGDEGWPY